MSKSSVRKGGAVAVLLASFLVIAAMARMGETPAGSKAVSSESATRVEQAKKPANTKKPAASPCSKVDDATLAARVKSALSKQASLKRLEIKVEAQDGVVTLSGKGAKRGHKGIATQTAQAVKCVKSVANNLICAEGFKSCPNGECVCDECTCPTPKPPKPPKPPKS